MGKVGRQMPKKGLAGADPAVFYDFSIIRTMDSKKSVKLVVKKLELDKDGYLTGGFSAIKGGFKSLDLSGIESTNLECTNTLLCKDTTNSRCSNVGCS